jgi:cytoskeleton protein RodZ
MSELLETPADELNPAPPSLPLPGAVLRAAREAQGYSLAEVAQVLKFGVRQLEALENDDYSTLKGATFIRGFVRSYARYLRLDEVPLLAALEPQVAAVAEVRTVDSVNAVMPSGVQDNSKRAYWLAAFVLLLGAVAWFAWQEQGASAPDAQKPETVPVVAAPEPAPVAASSVSPSQPMLAPTPAVIAPAAAGTAETAVPPAPVAASPSPNERQLLLSFSGVSWVEVRDASNQIIYSGNSTPDSRQALRGRPPFQLVIGNAHAVKLRYEDRAIDLQPHTRVDVARLTLDDNTK